MKRFFYFRNPSTITDDESSTGDSIMLPVENITGFQAPTDTTLDIYFKPIKSGTGGASGAIIADKVTLTVLTAKRREIMEALASATNSGPHQDGITVVADDVTSTYLTSDISAVAGVTIADSVS